MAQKRTGGTGRNRGRQPSIRFPKFMELPLEIRIQIYGRIKPSPLRSTATNVGFPGWIFPNGALLHILAGGVPTLYPCICEETENKSYKLQSSAITSEADSENALRVGPRQDPTHTYNAHRSCNRGIMCGRFRQCFLDMRLLSVSREVRAEAAKQLWSTNTFSFDYPSCPSVLLAKVPLDLWSHIRFVRLEMWMEGRASDPTSSTAKWADCLAGLSRDMTGLRSLHLAIYLNDFVTCWYASQGAELTNIFRPFAPAAASLQSYFRHQREESSWLCHRLRPASTRPPRA